MLNQILEKRRQHAIEELEAANNQLSIAIAQVDQLKIRRQIEMLENEVEDIDIRLSRLPDNFTEMMSGELQASLNELQALLPQSKEAIHRMTRALYALGQMHGLLNEWKELHNLLQECLAALSPLETELIYVTNAPERWDKHRGMLLWKACNGRFYTLEQFACSLKFIDRPYIRATNGTESGPPWVIDISKQTRDVGSCLEEGNHNAVSEVISELSHKCHTALYQADKSIRDVAAEIHRTTREITWRLEDE